MLTAFLLLPVASVLAWLYWYLLPDRKLWPAFDGSLLVVLAVVAAVWIHWATSRVLPDAGPLYPDLVAAVGAYAIILAGLAGGLALRRARARDGERPS
jgi:hypothetical protein